METGQPSRAAASSSRAALQQGTQTEQTDEDALIRRWLEPDPYKGGKAEYRVVGHGVQVWALAAYLRAADTHGVRYIDMAARDFELPRESVVAALAFYRRYREVVEDRVAANEA